MKNIFDAEEEDEEDFVDKKKIFQFLDQFKFEKREKSIENVTIFQPLNRPDAFTIPKDKKNEIDCLFEPFLLPTHSKSENKPIEQPVISKKNKEKEHNVSISSPEPISSFTNVKILTNQMKMEPTLKPTMHPATIPKKIKKNIERVKLSYPQRNWLAKEQNWKCFGYCKDKKDELLQLLPAFFEIDHIVPLYWGGSNARTNLQVLCSNCHTIKTQWETQVDSAYAKKQIQHKMLHRFSFTNDKRQNGFFPCSTG